MLLHCFHCGCGLDEIHEATGVPRYRLLTWPRPAELGHPLSRRTSQTSHNRGLERLPSYDQIVTWCHQLLTARDPGGRAALNGKPLKYLIHERGLTEETIRKHEIGYGRFHGRPLGFIFPIRNEHRELVTVKERYWPNLWLPAGEGDEGVKTRSLAGRHSHLYPIGALKDAPDAFVVCEGEFDALLLNQHGIPAVTSTASTSWKTEWNRHILGRSVAVLYDAGASSYELAEDLAFHFCSAGARDTWPVDLTLAGFSKGQDVTDWFTTYGWTSADLRAFIRANRRWFREARGVRRRRDRGKARG